MTKATANQEALSVLVGKKLAIWRRAGSMLVVHFGAIQRTEDRSWGEFAIHIQCPWRVLRDGRMFAAQSDLYTPAEVTEGFDWKKWYSDAEWPDNLLESQMLSVLKGTDPSTRSLENATKGLVVEDVVASPLGDATIHISGGYVLQLFAEAIDDEHWRLLDLTQEEDKHFVVAGNREQLATESNQRMHQAPDGTGDP